MLKGMNEDMDDISKNMVKLDSKLNKMLAKGSICKLWIIIIIEIVALGGLIS